MAQRPRREMIAETRGKLFLIGFWAAAMSSLVGVWNGVSLMFADFMGTVRPAKVLVLGAGVAGLQAIATARRLGAVVQAFDVRSAVKEQIESLGARFLELDMGLEDAEAAGGYARALTDVYYLKVLLDTMIYGVVATVICLVLGFPVAYHLARTRSRFKGLLYVGILSPLLVGVVVRCYGWIIILANRGLINNTLVDLGVVERHIPLMYNHFGVGLAVVHIFLPFMILPLLGVIQSINPSLEEAAQSLGASRWQTMRRVVIPLSLPGIQAGCVLVFVLTMSVYVIPILLGGFRVMIMPTLVVQQLLQAMLWPFGAALAFILSVAGGTAIYLYLRFTSRLMKGMH
jgi:putative spermidine/putrescine transport system permease protein